jgi:hypothetical protein
LWFKCPFPTTQVILICVYFGCPLCWTTLLSQYGAWCSSCPPIPIFINCYSTFRLVDFLSFHIIKRIYGACLSAFGFFYLTSCSPVPSILMQMIEFILLYCQIILHCVYILHPLYPLSVDRHLTWFHILVIVNSAIIKHRHASLSLIVWFPFLWFYTRNGTVGSYGKDVVNFKEHQYCSP